MENDVTPNDPILDEVVVKNNDEVVVVLNTNEHEPSYENGDEVGFEENDYIIIY